MSKQKTYILLTVIFVIYIAMGIPDGALGLAWPVIRGEMNLPLEVVSMVIIANSLFFILLSSQNDRIVRLMKTEKRALLGMVLLASAYTIFAVSPSLIFIVMGSALAGSGAGLIDTGLNDYVSRHFSSRHMNFMHCFWGMGASAGPIIMMYAMGVFGWRGGYVSIALIQGVVVFAVLFSIIKGIWRRDENPSEAATESFSEALPERKYLTSAVFPCLQILIFFLYVGVEGSIGLWISSVMVESRGFEINAAGAFPAVYFGCIMAGRVFFGMMAGWLSNAAMIRIGLFAALAGSIILMLSSGIVGIALIGLGFAPIFPCLMHETGVRFSPRIFSKLIGYQMVAAGAGGAVASFVVGMTLSRTSLEMLFPIAISITAVIFLVNELLVARLRK